MSIRIYALAQQLKVETKTILDALKTLGIENKGSALASLTEDEAVQVKTSIQKSVSKTSRPGTPTRPDSLPQRSAATSTAGKVPVIKISPKPAQKEVEPESTELPTEPLVAPPSSDTIQSEEETPTAFIAPEPSREKPSVELVQEDVQEQTPQEPMPPSSPVESIPPEQPQGPLLPPPIGKIDLTALAASEPRGSGSRKSPLGTFIKSKDKQKSKGPQKQNQPSKSSSKSGQVPKSGQSSKSGQSPKSIQPLPPITTGLSTPGHAAAVRREDYRGPMRVITDKIPNLDQRRKTEDGRPTTPGSTKGPVIRIAPIPKTPTAKPLKTPKEPAPQKPDAKLPLEAIRAAREGTSKLIDEHIRKHEERQQRKEEEKKAREAKKGQRKTGAKEPVAPLDLPDDVRSNVGKRRPGGAAEPAQIDATKKKQRRSGTSSRFREDMDGEQALPRQLVRKKKKGQKATSTAAPRKTDLVIQLPCTVKQFAEQTGLSVAVVIKKLLEMGTPRMLNAPLEKESAELLTAAFELHVDVRDQITLEDRLATAAFEWVDTPESLQPRPPVVTVLGHVDHGKTTLLDHILHMDVVAGEKGGITQHIRAYRVKTDSGEDITFVDTPGHEAFTEMRARGANCTDIAILVVAVDDGVMPQTEEAISHIKAAGVPIVVALNKMDIPGIGRERVARVLDQLAKNELTPSEWGGDVEVVECSALTGLGIDKLLNTLNIVAELHELKANPDRPAVGLALESELQAGQGVICKVLVQKGTLRTGDVVLCGTAYGRVKAMYDTLNAKKQLHEATPGTPVNLVGLDVAPSAGSRFCVLDDISDARIIAEQRSGDAHKAELAEVQSHVTLETLFQRISSAQVVQTLNVIIRADVRGSIEAIRKELGKLTHPEVKIKILQATVGGITEADVQLADASDAIIVGFNVVPDENARVMAERKKIQIRRYDIIYNLTNDVKAALEGMLKPIEQVKELGRALVQRVFMISRLGTIAGCRVIAGTIERDCKVRIIRESRIIGEYPLDSLKREKDDVKEVREGYECGMKLKGFNDLKEGDILETYKIEEVARTF